MSVAVGGGNPVGGVVEVADGRGVG